MVNEVSAVYEQLPKGNGTKGVVRGDKNCVYGGLTDQTIEL